jgi:hypothetical protein
MMPGSGFFENQDYGLDSRPFFTAIIVTCLPGIHRFAVMAAAISTERVKKGKKAKCFVQIILNNLQFRESRIKNIDYEEI